MAKEIERKFLPAKGSSIPLPAEIFQSRIKQGYILLEKGKQLRIRIYKTKRKEMGKGFSKSFICLKYTSDSVRDEYEYMVPDKDAKEIYSKCKFTLEKNRTTFTRGNETYDIDFYPNGIITVEVEFKSLKDSKKWVKPSWLGEEISGVRKYSNIALAKKNLKF